MNSYPALLLLLAACFCFAESAGPPPVGCRPGSRKVEGTRSCVCSRLAVWECRNVGHHQHKRYAAVQKSNPPPVGCRPGSRKVEGTRNCVCSRLAVWECRTIGQHQHHKRDVQSQQDEDRCNPGDRWTDDCNECKCSDTGYPLCTRMSCHPKAIVLKPKRSVSVPPGGRKCTPGQRWTDECGNRCSCRPNGSAVCTEMGCIRPKRSPQVKKSGCTPGETFMVDCSTCWCGPDGMSSGCTYKPCPPGHKPKAP